MPSYNKNMFTTIDPKCSRHSAQFPSALSATILDYYYKYGRNRDLEKYLRFRNRSSSGSSSIQLSPNDESRVGKSLENLNILESCLEPEKILQKSKSSESLNKSGHSKSGVSIEKDATKGSDNQIKLTTKKTVKSKKKYNINMDTSIEITLPQQLTQPSQQLQTSVPFDSPIQQDFSQQKIEFETCQTQTDRIEFPKTPNRSELDAPDIPPRPSSVASSAASISNKQRLEWDSMADVGYNKSVACNNLTNLTDFERNALKKFFASHGVSFDDEMIVFASKSKRSTSVPELTKKVDKELIKEKWEAAFQKILEEKYAKRNGKTKQVKVDQKRLWQSALMKFREKYGTHFNPDLDLCITDPAVHSTPILSDTSKGAIPKVKRQLSDTKNQQEVFDVRETIDQVEKACQTSMIATSSKECQADNTSTVSDEIIGLELDQDASTTDNSKESEKSSDCKGGLISATSFEFFAPNAFNAKNKENIPPWNKENVFPKDVGRVDDNKENVPPKLLDDDETDQNVRLSTPKNTTIELSSGRTDEMFGEISNLENDLTRGVEILFSLADSKEMTEEKKKKLVRKMIRRMTKAKYKDSTASSESIVSSEEVQSSCYDSSKSVIGKTKSKPNISGVNTLSSSSSANSQKESSLSSAKMKSSVNQNNSKENSLKDWLKPITNSELEHERKSIDKNVNKEFIEIKSKHQLNRYSSNSDESNTDSNILKFVEKQRKSQFEWIDKEICHLVKLKEYLKKKREADVMNDLINLDLNSKEVSSTGSDQSRKSGVIYENVTVCPRSANDNYAEVKANGNSKKGNDNDKSHKKEPKPKHSAEENFQSLTEKDMISNTSSSVGWNSHINLQQFVRDRKKLQTPNEDVASYAHAKQQEFIGKYERIRSRPIYTQPHSSDHSEGHYSEPHDNDRKTSSKKNTNDAYTSITGSDGFLSADSVSIPVANSTSNTTTHQYDTRASVGIQATSSLGRTAPIFKVKASCNCGITCNCVNARRPTIRVKHQTNDKQLQVIPKAISYDITFDEKKMKENSDEKAQRDDNRMKKEKLLRHSDTSSSVSSKDSKKKSDNNFVGNFGGCAKLSLQDHLKSARPDFVSKADERRKCLVELHNLREKRNEQRNRLFLLSSNYSLRSHMKTLNPPMITKRIFTTKAIKQQTRNRYNKLPEIVRKDEIERQNRIKRSNRIVRDMFNKKLQTRVLKGQTDLSNSVSVAAI